MVAEGEEVGTAELASSIGNVNPDSATPDESAESEGGGGEPAQTGEGETDKSDAKPTPDENAPTGEETGGKGPEEQEQPEERSSSSTVTTPMPATEKGDKPAVPQKEPKSEPLKAEPSNAASVETPAVSTASDPEKAAPVEVKPPTPEEPTVKKQEEPETKREEPSVVTSAGATNGTPPTGASQTNPLATLAAEAVKAGPAPTEGEDQNLIHAPETPRMTGGLWHSVGIFSGNSCKVTGFTTQDLSDELRSAHFDISKMPAGAIDETAVQKLEPGEFYRFRVRAFNSCGFGPWSDVATFRTTVPGFPSPPSGVKITSTKEGVHLSWHPPQDQSDEILEYSVYLAVKAASADGQNVVSSPAQMAFKRVYSGAASSCLVPSAVLTDAQVTTSSNAAGATTKPAILFRIAARNKKGYGPSIQVRWIQGEPAGSAANNAQVRRPAEEADPIASKKRRKD